MMLILQVRKWRALKWELVMSELRVSVSEVEKRPRVVYSLGLLPDISNIKQSINVKINSLIL